jgi:hypothetical protein
MQEPKRESERPVKVEVGQRWGNYTVSRVCKGQCEAGIGVKCAVEHVHYFEGGWDVRSTLGTDESYPFRGYAPGYGRTYLGGGPSGEARSTGEYCREVGPGGTICTLSPGHEGGHVAHGIDDFIVARYPRKPAPLTPPAPDFGCGCDTPSGREMHGPGKSPCYCACHIKVEVIFRPVYGRLVGETRAQDGTPLSALGKVEMKKPEPWVPSVTDWDLLPDAGR